MARDTSKDVTHQQSMSKLSEKSKQTSASLLNSTKATPKALADSGEMDGVLGQIYQLMVDNRKDELDQRKTEEKYKKTDTGKEEQRHQELLKALTVRRRPKPKRVIRREKKAEEKEAAKPTEPAKPTAPAKKPAETAKKPPEPAKKPPEPAKKPPEPAKKPPEPAKKPAEDTAKKAAEDRAKKESEDRAKKAAEDRAKKESEDRAKKAAEDKAKREADDRAKKVAEDKAKREADDRAKKAAEDKAKREADDRAKKTAEQVKPPEVKPPPKAEQVKPPEVKPPPKAEAAPAAPKPAQVKPPPTATKTPQELGKLSSKFETGGRKNAGAVVGWDSTGGTSYGTYQIAAKVGSMAAFLKFAEAKGETDIVSRLKSAGPADTGSDKGPFVDEWKKISAEKGKDFDKLQHDFIEDSQFKPAAKTLLQGTGYDVEKQSAAIKDVFFSTVVQHGPGSAKHNNGAYGIFKKAIQDNGGINADPKNIINSVYEIRGTKFGSSSEKVRKSVQDRFVQEKALALDMLSNDGTKVDQSSKENADLKEKLNKDKSAQTTNNTTTTNNQTNNVKPEQKVDDRPPHVRKQQQ